MLFTSIPFMFYFFPIILIAYYLCAFSRTLQNLILMCASLFFYAWGEPVYVFLMIGSILLNTLFGWLVRNKESRFSKPMLVIAIAANLLVLVIFKYLTFILDAAGLFSSGIIEPFNLPLPIGISFFTFQALSYVVDVYRGKTQPAGPFTVGLYISFFPQLIAGPIVTYTSVRDQIKDRVCTLNKFSLGISRFSIGFIKKVMISNAMAVIADRVFGMSLIGTDVVPVPAMLAWVGAIAYMLQIYFDFSAYSDMAIGLGLCFGFKFDENFNYPYIASSISDFWKRWHISLTNWFREYVYIPLGGNRMKNQDKVIRNLFIVWLLTGIWHGANLTFIVWGLYFFVFQVVERFFELDKKLKGKWYGHVYALFIVLISWVIFRSDNLYHAGRFMMNMFGLNNNGFYSDLAVYFVLDNIVIFVAAILFCMPIGRLVNQLFYKFQHRGPVGVLHFGATLAYPVVMSVLLLISISYLVIGSYNPFIYFNF